MIFKLNVAMEVDLDALAEDFGQGDMTVPENASSMAKQVAACQDDSWLVLVKQELDAEIGGEGITLTVTRG